MNNRRHPAEPDRALVEFAIIEMLQIAERQGITAADLMQMLDSGMRISDFLTAMSASGNTDPTVDCDFSNFS
jgi:hypothetical protein